MSQEKMALVIQKETGCTKVDADRAIDALIETITTELEADGDFTIRNLGTFKIKVLKAREGTNNLTGKPMSLPKRHKVNFKAGKMLLNRIQPEKEETAIQA